MDGGGKKPGAVTEKALLDFYFEGLAERAVERLHEVGFEKCKGNVMPVNPRWRGSLNDWMQRIDDRLVYQKGLLEPLDLIILSDARAIRGEEDLLDRVMERFFQTLRENKHVMKDFVESAVLMPTALSFFGNFKTEKSGEHKDKFNVKLLGWAPLILAVRMAALTQGILERNTLRRVRQLRSASIIKKEMESDLIEAYLIFVRFRIMNQIEQKDDGTKDANWINPDTLTVPEQERMRRAMKSVESLQKYMQETLLFGQPI
jgi:signal-transduction protein with cAMP-binding, CBS, and nucleotidyltransferase domain